MRKLLLATAGVIVLAGPAFAGNKPTPPAPPAPPTLDNFYAAALGVNIGLTAGNVSGTLGNQNRTTINNSFNGRTGLANANANAGNNSTQQNSTAVAYIEGCDCVAAPKPSNGFSLASNLTGPTRGDGDANTVAANAGAVWGNVSGNVGSAASANIDNSFNGGNVVSQVNSNAGANSQQQNATAVSFVQNLGGSLSQNRDAWAIAANIGIVSGSGNLSIDAGHNSAAGIGNSFNGVTGSVNVNQNAGANSLQQNSTALSAVQYCNCAATDLSTTIAAAGNLGLNVHNTAMAAGGSAIASINGSFNGGTGVAQVSNNVGANSLMQNSVAVGAVYRSGGR